MRVITASLIHRGTGLALIAAFSGLSVTLQIGLQTTFQRALENCTNQGLHLPVIRSDYDQKFLMNKRPNSSLWLGLFRQLTENWTFPDGRVSDLEVFRDGRSLKCAYYRRSKNISYGVSCFTGGIGVTCQTKDCSGEADETCITHSCNTSGWYHAREICSSQGAIMAVPVNRSLFLSAPGCKETWIPIRKEQWFFKDSTSEYEPLNFQNWDDVDGVLDKNCAIVTRDGTWKPTDCEEEHAYVCQNDSMATKDESEEVTTASHKGEHKPTTVTMVVAAFVVIATLIMVTFLVAVVMASGGPNMRLSNRNRTSYNLDT